MNAKSFEEVIDRILHLEINEPFDMSPALIWLANNAVSFGLTEPRQFLYASGVLSSFLDNTPTAVAFYDLARGLVAGGLPLSLSESIRVAGVPEILLKAICVGSVFFGSM